MACPVCGHPTGVRCCEFGADRPEQETPEQAEARHEEHRAYAAMVEDEREAQEREQLAAEASLELDPDGGWDFDELGQPEFETA